MSAPIAVPGVAFEAHNPMTVAKIHLDSNLKAALTTALDNYTDGIGIDPDDEDMDLLVELLRWLEEQ
jgi:hypothetical protein